MKMQNIKTDSKREAIKKAETKSDISCTIHSK